MVVSAVTSLLSHLMQVRELKPIINRVSVECIIVAPHAGAWIETAKSLCRNWMLKSHLMQVRELKQREVGKYNRDLASHLMQVRELKHSQDDTSQVFQGRTSCRCVNWNSLTSFRIASISCRTSCRCVNWNLPFGCSICWGCCYVAPHAGAWIETYSFLLLFPRFPSHLMQVRELKLFIPNFISISQSRTSCRCVNWNKKWLTV